MPDNIVAVAIIVAFAAVTFVIVRLLARRNSGKRRQREDAQQRAGESRQVRRARERRTHK